jgi:hypothetical protein
MRVFRDEEWAEITMMRNQLPDIVLIKLLRERRDFEKQPCQLFPFSSESAQLLLTYKL